MLEERPEVPKAIGTEWSFALVFSAFFLAIALLPLLHLGEFRWWAVIISAAVLLTGWAFPRVLRPLNIAWYRFGLALGAVMVPVVMGLIFFVTITPTGLALRLLGKDPLRRKLSADASSYWIERDKPEVSPSSMKNQY